jgi:hypothetical protein
MSAFQRAGAGAGGLPVAAASLTQSQQGKRVCEAKKLDLQALLDEGQAIRHGPLWQALLCPGEQLEAQGVGVAD